MSIGAINYKQRIKNQLDKIKRGVREMVLDDVEPDVGPGLGAFGANIIENHEEELLSYVDELVSFNKERKELKEMLKQLEWSGTEYGQGSGFMGSGNDGRAFPGCPVCYGIKPDCGAEYEFVSSAIGHKKDCSLKKLIDDD